MSPQLENGYTRIADEILEKVAQTKLNGTQLRILLIVWRSTYGWQKKEHELSEGFLSKATGIHKQQIKRELKTLIEKGILIVTKEATFSDGRVLKFNKGYLNSTEVSKKIPRSEKDTPTGSELDTTGGSELDTQNKDINKQYKDIVDLYKSCLSLPQPQKITDKRKKAIKARLNDYGFECVSDTINKAERSVFLTKGADKKWLNFDWIWNPNNFIKILEGKYSKEEKPKVEKIDKTKVVYRSL